MSLVFLFFFFFFQAEDGIRDPLVTGVQTCALPISRRVSEPPARRGRDVRRGLRRGISALRVLHAVHNYPPEFRGGIERVVEALVRARSEERRVGKEGRARGWPDQGKKSVRREKVEV